jgi:glucan biosynthesis protein
LGRSFGKECRLTCLPWARGFFNKEVVRTWYAKRSGATVFATLPNKLRGLITGETKQADRTGMHIQVIIFFRQGISQIGIIHLKSCFLHPRSSKYSCRIA